MPVLPFPRAKATELPQEPRLEQHRGEMDPAGERGYSPTSPQTSTHVPYTILPDWGLCRAGKNEAQNVSEEEGEGRNKSNSWWMFFYGHLQTSCCSSALPSTSLLHTPPGHPEGLPRILVLLSTLGIPWSEGMAGPGWLLEHMVQDRHSCCPPSQC